MRLFLIPLLMVATTLGAAESSVAQAAAQALADRVKVSRIITNDTGQVLKLALSNHESVAKGEKVPAEHLARTGLLEADVASLATLTDLQAIFLEKQPVGNDFYAVLGKLKHLKDVRLHYAIAPAKDDAALFINQLPGLEVLEIKHWFDVKGGAIDRFLPQPDLVKLELDTGHATSAAVPFIAAATKLKNLQLHRTSMGDADLGAALAPLVDLEVLEVRPLGSVKNDSITMASLRHFTALPKLRTVALSLEWGSLTWDQGVAHLAAIPTLRQVSFDSSGEKDLSANHPVIQRFITERPDVQVKLKFKIIHAPEGAVWESVDGGFDWGGKVTTHG